MRHTVWPRKGFWRPFVYRAKCAMRIKDSATAIAVGVACGVFISFTPFMGFHIAFACALAWLLGGNVIASVFGTAVGNPLTFPFIWLATYRAGSWMLGIRGSREDTATNFGAEVWRMIRERQDSLGDTLVRIGENFIWPMTLGGVPMGIAAGVLAYVLTKPAVATFQDAARARRVRLEAKKAGRGDAPSGGSAPA